jgi:6-phosphogluconolactonase (cycloisomerase 2 family)
MPLTGARKNNIAIFSINQTNGKSVLKGFHSSLGLHPRNFTLDKSGNYLLVANMLSDTIVVFKRNVRSGFLTATGVTIKVPQPSCLEMISF